MDGVGKVWQCPAGAPRGRAEETAGRSGVEVGEEREARQQFAQTSWRGKHKQTASDSSRGSGGVRRRGEAKHDLTGKDMAGDINKEKDRRHDWGSK